MMHLVTFLVIAVLLILFLDELGWIIVLIIFCSYDFYVGDGVQESLQLTPNQQYCLDTYKVTKVNSLEDDFGTISHYCVVDGKLELIP